MFFLREAASTVLVKLNLSVLGFLFLLGISDSLYPGFIFAFHPCSLFVPRGLVFVYLIFFVLFFLSLCGKSRLLNDGLCCFLQECEVTVGSIYIKAKEKFSIWVFIKIIFCVFLWKWICCEHYLKEKSLFS